jgi:mannosyltransferase
MKAAGGAAALRRGRALAPRAPLLAGAPLGGRSTPPRRGGGRARRPRVPPAHPPGARLILCPRHPRARRRGRGPARARSRPIARRSRGEGPAAVYLTDTLGETGLWFRLAPVAFLGGSLVPAGGHNPWEPASCGAAVLTGPGVANVEPTWAALVAAGGAAVVEGAGLAETVAVLWDDPRTPGRHAGGRAAYGPCAGQRCGRRRGWPPRAHGPPPGGLRDPRAVDVVAPNLKRRRSGVHLHRPALVPIQARDVAIAGRRSVAARQPAAPAPRRPARPAPRHGSACGTRGATSRCWRASCCGAWCRRLRLLFTSAAQRRHSATPRPHPPHGRGGGHVLALGGLPRGPSASRHARRGHGPLRAVPDRAALRASLGLDGFVLGSFGRLRPQKGTDLLVAALLDVLPRHVDARAVLMGGVTPDQRTFVDDLKARVVTAGLADRIAFLPEDPAWDIARWFQAARPLRGAAPHRGLRAHPPGGDGLWRPRRSPAAPAPSRTSSRPRSAPWSSRATAPRSPRRSTARSRTGRAWRPGPRAARPHVLARHRIEDEAASLNALYRELQGEPRLRDARVP